MIYGNEKNRQMARSILPAKRNGAQTARRTKAAINRKHRRRSNQQLNLLRLPFDHYDDVFDDTTREIKYMVRQRREADKLNHFETWAEQITRDVPVRHRLDHMREIMPTGMIGMHAMLHLRYHPAFRWAEHDQRPNYNSDAYHLYQARRRLRIKAQVAQILETPGLQTKLNRQIKQDHQAYDGYRRSYPNPGEPRLLYGLHDVQSFMDDIIRGYRLEDKDMLPHGRHPEWLQTFQTFCDRHHI